MFDPTQLLNISVDQATDTKLQPVPEGEYLALIESVDVKSGVISKGDKQGQPWARLDCKVIIDDPQVEAAIGRKPSIRAGIMLDLTDQGLLDLGKGKNVQLGRLREALNKNQPGVPFKLTDVAGQMTKVKVGHRVDPNDASIVYDEVKAFLKV